MRSAETPSSGRLTIFRLRADLGPQYVQRDQPPLVDGREFVELFDPSLSWDFHGSHDIPHRSIILVLSKGNAVR